MLAGALLCAPSAFAQAEKTLWLIEPLYPGQEGMVVRTEAALDKLLPKQARANEVVGKKELTAALAGKSGELECLFAQKGCADPIDALVAALGFDRVVLVRGGQDEVGHHFKVTSYRPASGEVRPADATSTSLEKALFGALVKVVPLAATLEVRSTPAGATVFVDEVRVGTTPLSTQVVPGEHVVKVDLKSHQPVEETLVIPVRGSAQLEKTLERVAARITVAASPPGTEIYVDGVLLGKDKVDRGIQPGKHTIRLALEKHRDFEQTIDVKPDDSYTLDKTLEPLEKPHREVGAPPPPPPSIAEQSYERRSYLDVRVDSLWLNGSRLIASRTVDGVSQKVEEVPRGARLLGVTLDYGTFGRFFGLGVIGVSYAQSSGGWSAVVPAFDSTETAQLTEVTAHFLHIRALQPQLRWALWRFVLSAQGGLEFRVGRILPPGVDLLTGERGLTALDLMVSGRASVRAVLFEGLFIEGSFGSAQPLLPGGAAVLGFGGGAGYAF